MSFWDFFKPKPDPLAESMRETIRGVAKHLRYFLKNEISEEEARSVVLKMFISGISAGSAKLQAALQKSGHFPFTQEQWDEYYELAWVKMDFSIPSHDQASEDKPNRKVWRPDQ